MTDSEDDIRYWNLTVAQASRHRTRVSRYWADIANHNGQIARRYAYAAVGLTALSTTLAVWSLLEAAP